MNDLESAATHPWLVVKHLSPAQLRSLAGKDILDTKTFTMRQRRAWMRQHCPSLCEAYEAAGSTNRLWSLGLDVKKRQPTLFFRFNSQEVAEAFHRADRTMQPPVLYRGPHTP